MDIESFWDWIKENNNKVLVTYYKGKNKIVLAIDGRTFDDFCNTFIRVFEDELQATIVSSAILIDVSELLNDEYTLQEIWDKKIENLNEDW